MLFRSWVVKAFVRNHQRVDFPGQWRALCESVGFTTLHEHRCWLVGRRTTQLAWDGHHVSRKMERKSFFRRDHELKAKARLWWEQVDHQGHWLAQAYVVLDTQYLAMSLEGKHVLPLTPHRILVKAQVMAYQDAGCPEVDTDLTIDYEVALCLEKPR